MPVLTPAARHASHRHDSHSSKSHLNIAAIAATMNSSSRSVVIAATSDGLRDLALQVPE
jgi:hypothetical protein